MSSTTAVLRLRLRVDSARKGPILDGYRAAIKHDKRSALDDLHVWDAVVLFEDVTGAAPGEVHIARAWVSFELPDYVKVGETLTFMEPPREADRGEVLELLVDDTPFALKDYDAAKTRMLRPLVPRTG